MKRELSTGLARWLSSPGRKPLVLRGARQVGKTWLARELARSSGRTLLEINFERDPGLSRMFQASDPLRIFDDLAMLRDHSAPAEESLLFLDEIQAAPGVLAKLRWFAEEMAELPVVAAGSLLEFALADFSHSMPVGRVSYAFVEPMGFSEYLEAHGQDALLQRLQAWRPGLEFSTAAHEMAREWFDRFQMAGGMPEVVATDTSGARAADCRDIQRDLTRTYQDDFGRYARRIEPALLHDVLAAATASLGNKFVYASVGDGVKQVQAKRALELLAQARLCTLIPHAAANGLPLDADRNDRIRKVCLVDVGLAHALWNTPAGTLHPRWELVAPAIRGRISEQITAQELRRLGSGMSREGRLFHWRREGGRAGEIDYVLEMEGRVLPVEVKSGATGAMKSLHQFMHDKRLPMAVRFDRNPPALQAVKVRTTLGQDVSYSLLSLPHYLCCCLPGILRQSDPV